MEPLACVASVSSRGSSRKLGQEQKKKKNEWQGRGRAIKLFLALPPRGHECSKNISYHEAENLKTNKTFYFFNSYLRIFIQGLTIGWIAVKNLKSLIIPILCTMIHCRSTIFHCWSYGHRSRILPGKSETSLCPPKIHVWVLELNAGLQVNMWRRSFTNCRVTKNIKYQQVYRNKSIKMSGAGSPSCRPGSVP